MYVYYISYHANELSDGGIHIKNGVYIQKFIDEHLL